MEYRRAGGLMYARAGTLLDAAGNNDGGHVHIDHLGSPVAMTRAYGVIKRENYTPYGETLGSDSMNADHPSFTGHVADSATGLTYMQARYYDPAIGRFLSIDPVTFAGSGGDPTYFNRYAYVGNDPINLIDPTGMIIECADSGSCTNEGGTELFNLSSISNDSNRALVGNAINSLSETGDFQSNV